MVGAVALVVAAVAQPADVRAAIDPAVGYVAIEVSTPSPGVQFERWQRADGPVEVRVARLSPETVRDRLRVVVGGEQLAEDGTRRETTTSMCLRYRCVAAVNADYWLGEGLETSLPVGAVVAGGEVVRSGPTAGHVHAVVGATGALDALGQPLQWTMRLATASGATLDLAGINRRTDAGVVAFTSRWSTATPVDPAATEWVVRLDQAGPLIDGAHGLTLLERRTGGGTTLGTDRLVLRATGAAVAPVDGLLTGAAGQLALELDTGGARDLTGGSPQLLDAIFDSGAPTADTLTTAPDLDSLLLDALDGLELPVAEGAPTAATTAAADPVADTTDTAEPRTMIGWDLAGNAILVTVDGRQPGWSAGVTLLEGAQLLRALGAVEGINLDGGGSSAFVAGGHVLNRPSDGSERQVTTALVVGPLEGFDFATPVARPTTAACPPGRVAPAGYRDVPPSEVHGPAVDCVTAWGVAAGVGFGAFDPGRPTSRGQMATFLARLLVATGTPLPVNPPNAFADDDASVHAPAIDALAALGVVGGRTDGTYGPDDIVTRGQMAAFLIRTHTARAGVALGSDHDYFADDSLHTNERDINIAAAAGLTGGTASGAYDPNFTVTRGQMATFLARLLDVVVSAGLAAPPF